MYEQFKKKMKFIGEGSNCEVYLLEKGDLVYKCLKAKRLPFLNPEIANLIIKDLRTIKSKIYESGVPVPKEEKIYFGRSHLNENNINIFETFEGESIRDIIKKGKQYTKIIDSQVKALINKLPQDIPVDTNPGNFTIDKKSDIIFIDFVPPFLWKYRNNRQLSKRFIQIFPTIGEEFDYPKKRSYHFCNNKRYERYLHHINILRNNCL